MSKTRLDIIRTIADDPFDEVNSGGVQYLIDLVDQAGKWLTKKGMLSGGGGHDRKGKWHKVYPKPGTWSIEQDEPGCNYGLWFRPDGKMDGDEGTEVDTREQVKECTCGYNDLLRALGKEVD